MNFREEALRFEVAGDALIGIAACPDLPLDLGILIVVGGPQYRVGSHRQFLLLSRRLAAKGYPCLRFDVRGMGDSDSAPRSFETIDNDIAGAIDALCRTCPSVERIVLWGLCDAASAALLYLQATHDPRIAGVVLLNPWVRSEASLAKTHLRHYYGQRLLQPAFWRKLFGGRMHLLATLRQFLASVLLARSRVTPSAARSRSFQARMAEGLSGFDGQALLILSGRDFTASEFTDHVAGKAEWAVIDDASRVQRVALAEADHTFSSRNLRNAVAHATLDWLAGLERS